MSFLADPKTVEERRAICAACPFKVGGLLARCRACGCVIKAKTALESSSCPKGKW